MRKLFILLVVVFALGCDAENSGVLENNTPQTCNVDDFKVWDHDGEGNWTLNDCCDSQLKKVGEAHVNEDSFFSDSDNCGGCGIECGENGACLCEWVEYTSGVLLDCGCIDADQL